MSDNEKGAPARTEDASGRDRLAWNVVVGWAGHLVFIVTGFVMPRLMDQHVGQSALGIWDFSWSLMNYFNLAGLGVGASVNRYIAMYRAAADSAGVRRAASSVLCVQLVAGLIMLLLSLLTAWLLPLLFAERFSADIDAARWVVVLLGGSLAVHMAFDTFGGVVTGCHRWDLHNAINSGSHVIAVVGMFIVLMLGGGLRGLGMVQLGVTVATEVIRALVAYRVCPELRVGWAYAEWGQSREMLVFGIKKVLDGISRLLLIQSNSIIVASYLGPVALAVYARPSALIRHVETLVNKFAFVLTPTASSLHGAGREEDLRHLFLQSSRGGAFLVLPMSIGLTIFGDALLHLWMGPRYVAGNVMTILALGYILPVSQQPASLILAGMNLHGQIAVAMLGAAVGGILMGIVTVGFLEWGLEGAALSVAIPLMIGNGLFVQLYVCRRVGIPLMTYFRETFTVPLACMIPFSGSLLVCRALLRESPLATVGVGSVVGALVLGSLYWRYAIPTRTREQIGGLLAARLGWVGATLRQKAKRA